MSEDTGALATLACLLEASAAKPGNVSPGRPFRDMTFEDFAASAVAIGPELARAAERPIGETILAAVRATRRWVGANTNLGIILLLAPLAAARRRDDVPARWPLRRGVREVLLGTTNDDARLAYAAIREARPGGMGGTTEQDLSAEPTVTLRGAMALAAARDSVAAEWVTDFRLTFEVGAPAVRAARAEGLGWEDTTVSCYLDLLAVEPDTLIVRKLGRPIAEEVREEARRIVALGGVRQPAGRARIAAFDQTLRDPHNSRNPGTSADLTAAALFTVLAEDGWQADHSRTARAQ